MKKLCMLLISCFTTVIICAQPVSYTVRVTQLQWREIMGLPENNCFEFSAEEFVALVWFDDNVNGTNVGGECFTCNSNGGCTINPNFVLGSRNNTCAETINIIFQGYEQDGGDYCTMDEIDSCKCGPETVASINFRDGGPGCRTYGSFGCRNDHDVSVEICWNYTESANNECASPVTVNTGSTYFTLSKKCTETDITSCTYNDYNDTWYKYTVGNDYLRSLQIDTEGSDYNTALSLFDACGGNEVACDNDSGSGNLSNITLDCVPPGTEYYIRISGHNGDYGSGTLNITEFPDSITDANSPVHANITNGNHSVAILPCFKPVP